jgi:hypothetical protein
MELDTPLQQQLCVSHQQLETDCPKLLRIQVQLIRFH